MRRCRRPIPSRRGARAARGWRAALAAVGLLLALDAAARAQEVPRLTFAQLGDAIRANATVTESIRSYAGKEVEIQGFIIPACPPDLSFFLLARVSAVGNYCCELPSGQDETVYVYAAKGLAISYDPLRVYKVRGVFEAGAVADKANGISFFRIRNARVEEAVGAKIFKVGDPSSGR